MIIKWACTSFFSFLSNSKRSLCRSRWVFLVCLSFCLNCSASIKYIFQLQWYRYFFILVFQLQVFFYFSISTTAICLINDNYCTMACWSSYLEDEENMSSFWNIFCEVSYDHFILLYYLSYIDSLNFEFLSMVVLLLCRFNYY